jgi:hypothetical protein
MGPRAGARASISSKMSSEGALRYACSKAFLIETVV